MDPAGCSVQCADCGRPATSGHYRSSSDCSVQLSVSQSVRGLRAPLKCSNTTRDISTPRRQLESTSGEYRGVCSGRMTKILEKKVRNSPILVSRLYRNWDTSYGRKKMIKMSLKKLKKIGDPETLLCRAVLINNTLETVKSAQSPGEARLMSDGSLERSQYNEDELKILNKVILPHCDSPGLSLHDNKGGLWSCNNTITLPEPITPLSDDEDSELVIQEQNNSNVSTQVEDLLEQNRREIFNSYFQLCSNDKYDCTSVMAA